MTEVDVFVLLAGLLAVGWFVVLRKKPRLVSGHLSVSTGDHYYYALVESADFAGIRVELPKAFPHLYLDSHHDSKYIGPRSSFHPSQKLRLEGDFNTHFQLFAPKDYQILALSVLTPDTMQTILTTSQRYDIEIKARQLCIFVDKKFIDDSTKVKEVVAIATDICNEIAHKAKSWTPDDQRNSIKRELRTVHDRSLKLGSHYIRFEHMALFGLTVLPAIPSYAAAYYIWSHGGEEWVVCLALGMLFFPFAWMYIWPQVKNYSK